MSNKYLVLDHNINIFYAKNISVLCLYKNFMLKYIKLPRKYFYKIMIDCIEFLVHDKFTYKNIFANVKNIFISFWNLRLIRIRLRGLGYEIDEITSNIHSFFFNRISCIYLYSPINVIIRVYKKRFILLSKIKFLLKLVLKGILLLKRMGPYNMRGFWIPKTIRLRKKSGKKV